MKYYLNLFSPDTYETFSRSPRSISGFRIGQKKAATRIEPGDKFICYMTKLSRWIGILEVRHGPFEDPTPFYYEQNDPFILRFEVNPIIWLPKDKAVPIRDDRLWNQLSFTRGLDKHSSAWTGRLRASLSPIALEDARTIETILSQQARNGEFFPVDPHHYRKLVSHPVRRLDKSVSVSVPQEFSEEPGADITPDQEIRQSLKIQAIIADIGTKMGFRIWIPRGDRSRVQQLMTSNEVAVLDILPLNYDEATLTTIENIDVLWLRGRAIARAFEVEHSTSIYSGILRMADLLALQPNMAIKLHIVAPEHRKLKVFDEIRRPVFSFLDRGPLAESCTFLSYDSLEELAKQRHLHHLSDSVLDDYAEEAE